MAVRFRKSIKLAPGIRMNLTGGGIGWSLGPRGASIGIGQRGVFSNIGLPGTGLHARNKIGGGQTNRKSHSASVAYQDIKISVGDDGALSFKTELGNPLQESLVRKVKQQHGDTIRGLIKSKCDEINDQVDAIVKLHEFTSHPIRHTYVPNKFDEDKPCVPPQKTPGFFCKFFKRCANNVEKRNADLRQKYAADLAEWEARKEDHDRNEKSVADLYNRLNLGDVESIEQYFESVLSDIAWPRETLVAFEVLPQGVVVIDIDLPEICDMPTKVATMHQTGFKLTVKEISETKLNKLYLQHIHSVGFRVAGEAFAASPEISKVVLSAYSQRANKETGKIVDEYLYSAVIDRSKWMAINFENLSELDVVSAFNRFELKREMTSSGIIKPIEPFSVSQPA